VSARPREDAAAHFSLHREWGRGLSKSPEEDNEAGELYEAIGVIANQLIRLGLDHLEVEA
jgi:hypothetical protein